MIKLVQTHTGPKSTAMYHVCTFETPKKLFTTVHSVGAEKGLDSSSHILIYVGIQSLFPGSLTTR